MMLNNLDVKIGDWEWVQRKFDKKWLIWQSAKVNYPDNSNFYYKRWIITKILNNKPKGKLNGNEYYNPIDKKEIKEKSKNKV